MSKHHSTINERGAGCHCPLAPGDKLVSRDRTCNDDINLDDLDNEELADHIHWNTVGIFQLKKAHDLTTTLAICVLTWGYNIQLDDQIF